MFYSRRLPRFEYHSPGDLGKACSVLDERRGQVRVLAGGTITLAMMKERRWTCNCLISLKNVPGLEDMAYVEGEGLRLGAMVNHRRIADSPAVQARFSPLASACAAIGSPQIRNMGTIGGNICCKFPRAEIVPPLVALRASATITANDGERIVPVEDVPKALKRTDILTEIRIPEPDPKGGGAYVRYCVRKAVDYANVGVAVYLVVEDGVCRDVRIALGGVPATSRRAEKAEGIMRGVPFNELLVSEASHAVSNETKVFGDLDFSAAYKRELLGVMTRRALRKAWESAVAV